MPFKDWTEIAKNDLVLPINGKPYTIPPLGFLDEIRIRESQAAAAQWLDARDAAVEKGEEPPPRPAGIPDEEFMRMILGGVLQEMRNDNVPGAAILHAVSVAHTAALFGREAAEALWEKGLDPEAVAAATAAIRGTASASPSSTGSTRSRSTASGSATRSPAPMSTTTSRQGTRPRKAAAKKAAGSSGATSSRNAR